jgi:hypothetical protein
MCDRMKMYNINTCMFVYISLNIWIQVSSKVTRRHENPIGPQWLWSKHSITLLSALRHLGTHLAGSFHIFKIFWVIQFTLSRDIATISAIFLADILRSSRIMQWMACMFPGIVTSVGLPERSSSWVLKCPALNPATQFLTASRKGAYRLM